MRRLALFLCLAVGFTLPAGAYTPYHQFRQDFPDIDDAVATLPNSSLHGTLNRISALQTRAPVRDFTADDLLTEEDLPSNYVRGMELALQDLRSDLETADAAWATDEANGIDRRYEKLVLLQILEETVFTRNLDLLAGDSILVCQIFDGPVCSNCLGVSADNPEIYNEMERIVVDVIDEWFVDAEDWINENGQAGLSDTCFGMHALDYPNKVQILQDALSIYIPGIPIICD